MWINSRRLGASVACLALVFGSAACDDDDDLTSIDDRQVYVADLDPLNNSGVDGTATIIVDDGQFAVTVEAIGLDDVLHPQHIHAAAQCPTFALDRADDGDDFVDVLEAVPAYGPILVPLDNLLAQVMPGDFPQGNIINYSAAISLDELVATLRSFQPPNAAFAKLGANEELNPATRTIVVHGTARNLPASVQSIGGLPAQVTLPVACGTLELVED